MRFSPSGVSWCWICSPLSQKFITPLNRARFFTFLPTLSGTEIQPLPRRRVRGVPVARPGCRPGVPGGSLTSQNTKTARFEGSMASIKIPFFQDQKPQFLRHGNLATPPEFRVNLGLIRCTDQGAVHTCPYSTSNRPSRSLHSTERRRRCLDFSPSAHHTRCPPWWSLCMAIEPY